MDTMAGAIPSSATMSATEVVEWIAFGERRPHDDLIEERRAHEDWCLTLPVEEVLQAAEAMAALAPFCLWLPLEEDVRACVPREKRRYLHQMGSPCGPRLLDEICARLAKRLGQRTSYADLAARIVPEANAFRARCKAREAAMKTLIERVVGQQLTAWGRPDGEDGYPDDRARFVAIPHDMQVEDDISLEGDRLISSRSWGPGPAGRSYSKVRFRAAEVAAVWPASRGSRSAAEDGGPLAANSAARKCRVATDSLADPESAEQSASGLSVGALAAAPGNRPHFLLAAAHERFSDLIRHGQPVMTRPEMESLIAREFSGKPTDAEMRKLMEIWPNRKRGRRPRNSPKPPQQGSGSPRKF